MISIQKVTKETGISVRTLRYYDEINLLPPAGKTEGGHRLYGETELKRLQEIQFLKSVGFRLKEMKEILAEKDWNWAEGLQKQLSFIMREKDKMIEMELILKGIINSYTVDGYVDMIHLQKLIHLSKENADKQKIYRKHLFNDEEEKLLDLLPNMNSGDPDTMEWVSLIAQMKRHQQKGVNAKEVQSIIRRIYDKTNETFGEETSFLDKVWEIRKSPEKSEQAGFYPIDKELLDFFERAWIAFEKSMEKR